MTILLYDYFELDERSSKQLSVWKAWHLILYICAAVFGMANYVFLQKTMEMVDDNCVLFPRKLEFYMVVLADQETQNLNEKFEFTGNVTEDNVDETGKIKRDAKDDEIVIPTMDGNVTAFTGQEKHLAIMPWITHFSVTLVKRKSKRNTTHRLVLDTFRTLFEANSDCQFAEYMPLLSTIFAAIWITMFTMCPRGGRARTGLQQPWRILAPALLFSLVMVGLTGHSFTLTNSGIQEFCAAFYEITNSTTCSSVDSHLEHSWNTTWGFGARVAATRATCAGVLAAWACAAALLLSRCLAAPDFVLRRTDVYLTKDPQQKVIPHLLKSQKYHQRSNQSSPSKRDNASVRSEATITTELVTASVEQGQDTAPSSLVVTPARTPRHNHEMENIEMTYTPQERINSH